VIPQSSIRGWAKQPLEIVPDVVVLTEHAKRALDEILESVCHQLAEGLEHPQAIARLLSKPDKAAAALATVYDRLRLLRGESTRTSPSSSAMPSRAASASSRSPLSRAGVRWRRDRRSPIIRYIPHEAPKPACTRRPHGSSSPVAGRQSGKSLAAIAELGSWVMERTGRGMYYWVTANYRVKDRAWRGLAEHLPREIVRRKHESDLFIELKNGTRIYIRSADAPESLVSETLDGLVCDEAAQWKPTSGRNTSGHARGTAGARGVHRHAARA